MTYRILFHNASVQADIAAWPAGISASFVRIAEQIAISGPNLGLPYTKAMGEGLFEIRARGQEGIGRAFFCCMAGRKVVILHGFKIARKRMKEIEHD